MKKYNRAKLHHLKEFYHRGCGCRICSKYQEKEVRKNERSRRSQ